MNDPWAEFLISSAAWQGLRHSEAIAAVREAGFAGVEILCKPGHFEYDNANHVDEVQAALGDWPDAIVTFHAPFYGVDLSSSDPEAWNHAMRETMRALEVASSIKAETMTVHVHSSEVVHEWISANLDAIQRALEVESSINAETMTAHGLSREETGCWSPANLTAFRRALGQLAQASEEAHITLAVENFPPPFFTSDEEELLRLLDEFPEHLVGACIDTGHAHLGDRLVELARLLAPRTFVAHLHDNFARAKDEHLIPGRGTIPWTEFVDAMRGFRGRPVMEVVMVGTLGETLAKVKTAIVDTGLSQIIAV